MSKHDTRFFDELAKVATGAVGAISGIRGQIQSEIKSQINKFIIEMDFVPREEFDITEAVAKQASLQVQTLEKRVAELELQLGIKKKPVASKPKAKASKSTPKTKPKKKSSQ